jgi:LuxR family transcriptional regulator, maltose regulon positive regulatory protein
VAPRRAVSRPSEDGSGGGIASASLEIHDDVGYVGALRRPRADRGKAMTRIPLVTDGTLQGTDVPETPAVVVGSPAWFAWLADDSARSFSFRSSAGDYTARKERKQRGGAYWVAYRTSAGRQYKKYLGRVADLTPEHLAEAAAALAERIADAAPVASDGIASSSGATGSSGSPGHMARNAAGLLLATKLFIPRPRPDLVPRPRLLIRLDEGLDQARCSLLSAPAGAGKTSLLATWVARLDRPVAWLALDERDKEVHQVLRYLVASLQTIASQCGRTALALLEAPPPASPEAVLTSLLNDLADLPAAALLILDDYHLVREPAVHAAIEFLLNHLPPTLHLVIATREDPPLPLPRLRASRQIVEVRAADLSFNVEEAAAFLGAGMGLRLTEQQVAALVERTEGWAAGLQLAGLALRDRTDPAPFVEAFTGGHRLVVDYLMAEVLERQPVPVRRFLLVTSVLDRLCAPLCDALLATDLDSGYPSPAAVSSQQLLEELERANLFLVPLDDDRTWYRYHHLFADALRGRLAREVGSGAAALLHRQASAWFGRQGLLPEAIGHALAADAVDDAATWLEDLMPSMFATMSIHQALADWLSALPEPVVRSRPLLCLAQAWLLIHRVELEAAAGWVEAAARALPLADDSPVHSDAAHRAHGAVAATRAYMATVGLAGVPKDVDVLAEQALADLAPDDSTFRGAALLSLGQATLALGQLDRAEKAFTEAAMVSRAAGLVHGAVVCALQQVNVQRLRGGRRRALATGWATLAWAGEHLELPSMDRIRTVMADLLLDANDVAGALPLAVEGLRGPREYGNPPPLVILASLPLARLRLAEGDSPAAAAALSEVRPLVQHGPFAALAPLVDAAEARVGLALDEGAAALPWAIALDPSALPGGLRFGVPGVEATVVTPLRILVAQGRAMADAALLQEAERRLDGAWHLAEHQGIGWLRVPLHIAQSLVADARGHRDAALRSLTAAVAEAEPEGITRPFLDEGAPMAALLTALRATDRNLPRMRPEPVEGRASTTSAHIAVGTSPDYLDALLAAFTGQKLPAPETSARTTAVVTGFHPGVLVEPLSARELDVLRLLSDGRSNAEIARELFVEQSTVKTHLIHLYRKLSVSSRTQAINRARTLRLLD